MGPASPAGEGETDDHDDEPEPEPGDNRVPALVY